MLWSWMNSCFLHLWNHSGTPSPPLHLPHLWNPLSLSVSVVATEQQEHIVSSLISWPPRNHSLPESAAIQLVHLSVIACYQLSYILGCFLQKPYKDLTFKHHLVFPVGSIQVSCYRILNSLYSLGTSSSIYMDGYCLFYNVISDFVWMTVSSFNHIVCSVMFWVGPPGRIAVPTAAANGDPNKWNEMLFLHLMY